MLFIVHCEDGIKPELQEIALGIGSSATVAGRSLVRIPGEIAHQCGTSCLLRKGLSQCSLTEVHVGVKRCFL